MSRLTAEQVEMLMLPIHSSRVYELDGNSHVAAWDIRAMLTRVFGFAGWSETATEPTALVHELPTKTRKGAEAFRVCYRAARRITLYDSQGHEMAHYDATAIAEQTMPDFKRGDAHDFAARTAESTALKRACSNLGSQFGLSLYNGGSMAEVIRKLADDPREDTAPSGNQVEVEMSGDADAKGPNA